jgi:hypothetical protein
MSYQPLKLNHLLWSAGVALTVNLFGLPSIAQDLVGFTSGPNEAPKTNVGGGRRTNDLCKEQNQATLLPYSGTLTTTHDRPHLIAAIPSALGATHIFLNLTNEAGEELYHGTLPLEQSEDMAALVLPEEVPALVVGESYHWSAALICNHESNQLNPDDPVFFGVVQRVETTN